MIVSKDKITEELYNPDNIVIELVNHWDREFYDFLENLTIKDLRHLSKHNLVLWKAEESHIIVVKGEIQLFDYLHNFASAFNVPVNNIYFINGNLDIEVSYLNWAKYENFTSDFKLNFCPFTYFEGTVIRDKRIENDIKSKRKKHYVCLNGFSRNHRQRFLLRLYELNLLKQGLVSYFNYYHDSKWHVPDFFPEKLIKMLPMEIDVASGEHYSTMAVLNTHDMDLRHIFDNCYFSVVTETVYDEYREHDKWHVETFLTEKTFKSIMNMHPFILLSAPGSLEHLRKLGYKTFPNSIDESYDKEINAVKRMDMVL